MFHCGLGIGAEESGSHDAQVSYKLYDHTASADVSNTESKLRCYDYGGNGLYMQVGANFTIQIDSWGTTAKTFTATTSTTRTANRNNSRVIDAYMYKFK